MDRARRIWHRGWLRRAITAFSFGWFPLNDGVPYVVTADVECRFVGLMDSALCVVADAGAELRISVADDLNLRTLATSGKVSIRIDTGILDVRL